MRDGSERFRRSGKLARSKVYESAHLPCNVAPWALTGCTGDCQQTLDCFKFEAELGREARRSASHKFAVRRAVQLLAPSSRPSAPARCQTKNSWPKPLKTRTRRARFASPATSHESTFDTVAAGMLLPRAVMLQNRTSTPAVVNVPEVCCQTGTPKSRSVNPFASFYLHLCRRAKSPTKSARQHLRQFLRCYSVCFDKFCCDKLLTAPQAQRSRVIGAGHSRTDTFPSCLLSVAGACAQRQSQEDKEEDRACI